MSDPRCNARRRWRLGRCRRRPMANGRCWEHGGLSTGPRTPAGRAVNALAHMTHGIYQQFHTYRATITHLDEIRERIRILAWRKGFRDP